MLEKVVEKAKQTVQEVKGRYDSLSEGKKIAIRIALGGVCVGVGVGTFIGYGAGYSYGIKAGRILEKIDLYSMLAPVNRSDAKVVDALKTIGFPRGSNSGSNPLG